jgi:hypothetical protein
MNKTLYQRLDSFDGGMNSGVDPLKVKINQSVYCTNGTFRGDFFKTRPNFRNIPLTFIATANPQIQVAAITSSSSWASGITTVTVLVTCRTGHGLIAGDTVSIQGSVPSTYNGSAWTVSTVPSYNTFTYAITSSVSSGSKAISALTSAFVSTSATATATASAHGFTTGDYVTIAGVTPSDYNGVFQITVPTGSTTTFTYVLSNSSGYILPAAASAFGTAVKGYQSPASTNSIITATRSTSTSYYTAAQCQSNFQTSTALFQNAAYYISDSKVASVMVAVGGKLFQIIPSTGASATVQQIFVPNMVSNTNNNPLATQSWMWQSEAWLIWNDGTSDPVFFDGQSCRRSIGQSTTSVATVNSRVQAPVQGQQVAIPVAAPYVGPTGVPVLVGQATYTIAKPSSDATLSGYVGVSMQMLDVTAGDSIQAGVSSFSDSDHYVGAITAAYSGSTTFGTPITVFPAVSTTVTQQTISVISSGYFTLSGTTTPLVDVDNCTDTNQCFMIQGTSGTRVGSYVTIGNNKCTVTKVWATTTGSCNVNKLDVIPNANYTGSISASSLVLDTPNPASANGRFTCKSGANYSQAGAITTGASYNYTITTSDGSANWGASATVTSPVYFTIVVSRPTGTLRGASLSVGSNTFTVTSVINQTTFVCQMVSGSAVTIPILSATYPTLSQIVINNSVLQNQGITYFTYTATPPTGTTSQSNVSITANTIASVSTPVTRPPIQNQILWFTTTKGNTCVAIVSSVSSSSVGSTTYYIQATNQTDTLGNWIEAGTSIRPVPELPTGTIGTYGIGRNWMALPDGKSFIAGDLSGGASGSGKDGGYKNRDAVLKVSENTYLNGGGTFSVPSNSGEIKAMQFMAQLDVSLGQGPLQVLTQTGMFSCNAPVDRTTWQSLKNPILAQSLIGSGGASQNAVTQVSGDILFRASDGSIRSMLLARLDFNRWGNTPISREMDRLISQENVGLMFYSSAVNFDNRFLLTAKPTQSTRGVYHPSLIALNFDPNSTMSEKKPAIYDGEWTGLNVLQIMTGIFNGVQRCFCMCLSSDLTSIEMHEVLLYGQALQDDGVNVVSSVETGELHFGDREEDGPHLYKRLSDGEIFVDRIYSDVKVDVYYQPDQWQTWTLWSSFTIPYAPYLASGMTTGFNPRVGLNEPDGTVCDSANNRPLREGYVFQLKIQITGNARITGGRFAADVIPQSQFAKQICAAVTTPVAVSIASPSIYAGVTQNPNTLIYPQSASSQSLYYSDSATVSLWYWSVFQKWVALKAPSNPVALPATYGTAVLFTQGNQQVMIGKYATPPATVTYTQAASSTNPFPVTSTALFAPPIPTQPCLYYQDQPVTGTAAVNLYQWSPINKTWMAILVGSSSDVVMPALVASYSQPITVSTAATPTSIQPANAAAIYVQDAATPKMWLWSINKGAWFQAI